MSGWGLIDNRPIDIRTVRVTFWSILWMSDARICELSSTKLEPIDVNENRPRIFSFLPMNEYGVTKFFSNILQCRVIVS